MPVEIRELVIRAAVAAAPQQQHEGDLEALLLRLKSDILQECEARLQEQLVRNTER